MILLIDNYDSFTFNLYQYLSKYRKVMVKRNDEISICEIEKIKPKFIVLSPGPKRPQDAGICIELIKKFYKKIPILGVCLGHQCIGEAFGSKIEYANDVIHGKASIIKNNGKGIFEDLDKEIEVGRYHSLIISKESISDELEITAETKNGEIMAVKHIKFPTYGVQFHPESIMTKVGYKIIENFLKEE
jgi:anthranilate synthase component 2